MSHFGATDISGVDGRVDQGSSYLTDTPALQQHYGSQPDLFVSWTPIEAGAQSVDVVLYFHGYAVNGEREALLSDFVDISGLDSATGGDGLADRKRPTIAIVPRGNASPTRSNSTPFWPYYFPAMANGGAASLIDYVLQSFSSASQSTRTTAQVLQLGRLIVMGHSGGGKGVVQVLKSGGRSPDEIYLFDALYEDPGPPLADWITCVIDDRSPHQRMWIGHLGGTAKYSNRVREACDAAIEATPATRQADLRGRLRVELVEGEHLDVPRRYARALLAAGDPPIAVS